MFEAYKIGVSLALNDLVTPQIIKLSAEFSKLDLKVLELGRNLKAVGAESASLRSVANAGNATARALDVASSRAAVLERRLLAIRAAGNIPAIIPSTGNGFGGGGGGGRGGRHGHMGGEGGRVHMGTSVLGMGAMSYGLGSSAFVPLAIGAGSAYAAHAGYEAAKDFQLEAARFQALGLGPRMNAEAIKFVQGFKSYGISQAQNMALFRDAQMIFRDAGSLEHAKMVLPLMAKMRMSNETLFGSEHAGNIESKFLDMLKVIELRKGLSSTKEFATQANMIQQVLTTSGGRVDATQYLNLIKTGGVAAKSLSNSAMYYDLEPIIQEMGGNRVGTGLMSAYTNLIIGRMLGKKPLNELMRLGLLDPSKIVKGNGGSIKEFKAGALRGSDLMQSSPVDFMEKVLLPAFAKQGITKEADVLRELGVIFTNRTASNLFSTIYQQLPIIKRGREASSKALTIEDAADLAKKTASGAEGEFIAAWRDFKTELGRNILPQVTEMLTGGAKMLRELNGFMSEHKGLMDNLNFAAKWGNPMSAIPAATSGVVDVVRSAAGKVMQVTSEVHLDGQKVATAVTKHQDKAIQRAARGGGTVFDPTQNLPAPMLNYGR